MTNSPLHNCTRRDLTIYMVDVHGFNKDDVNEWETKADLVADIISYGWEQDCLEYLI